MSDFSTAIANHKIEYCIFVVIETTDANGDPAYLRYCSVDAGLASAYYDYPQDEASPIETNKELDGINGAYSGLIKSIGMANKELPQADIDDAGFLVKSTLKIELLDVAGALAEYAQSFFSPVKRGLIGYRVNVILKPRGYHYSIIFSGEISDFNFDHDCMSLVVTDCFREIFKDLQGMAQATQEIWPDISSNNEDKYFPIVYGQVDSQGITDKGFMELFCLDGAREDNALAEPDSVSHNLYAVASHQISGIARFYFHDSDADAWPIIPGPADPAPDYAVTWDSTKGVTYVDFRGKGSGGGDTYVWEWRHKHSYRVGGLVFHANVGGKPYITDNAGGLALFVDDRTIEVIGTVSNDGIYDVEAAYYDKIVLRDTETLINETAPTITILGDVTRDWPDVTVDILGKINADDALITNPVEIVDDFILEHTGYLDKFILSRDHVFEDTYAGAYKKAAQLDYEGCHVIEKPTSPERIIKDICRNFMLRLYRVSPLLNSIATPVTSESVIEIELLNIPTERAIRTYPIDLLTVDWSIGAVQDILAGSFKLESEAAKIANIVKYKYCMDFSGQTDDDFAKQGRQDSAQSKIYNNGEFVVEPEMDWVADDDAAVNLAIIMLWRYMYPLYRIQMDLPMNASAKELTAVGKLTHEGYSWIKNQLVYLEKIGIDMKKSLCPCSFLHIDQLWNHCARWAQANHAYRRIKCTSVGGGLSAIEDISPEDYGAVDFNLISPGDHLEIFWGWEDDDLPNGTAWLEIASITDADEIVLIDPKPLLLIDEEYWATCDAQPNAHADYDTSDATERATWGFWADGNGIREATVLTGGVTKILQDTGGYVDFSTAIIGDFIQILGLKSGGPIEVDDYFMIVDIPITGLLDNVNKILIGDAGGLLTVGAIYYYNGICSTKEGLIPSTNDPGKVWCP